MNARLQPTQLRPIPHLAERLFGQVADQTGQATCYSGTKGGNEDRMGTKKRLLHKVLVQERWGNTQKVGTGGGEGVLIWERLGNSVSLELLGIEAGKAAGPRL